MVTLISLLRLRLFLLLGLAAGLYWFGLNGPFFFDDGPAITGNGHLEISGAVLDEWRTATLSSNSGPLHRPVAMLSFATNIVAIGEVDAFSLKLVNLLIHLVCGIFVYCLARLVLGRALPASGPNMVEGGALLAMALWLLAPLHVSTVLYTVQRMAQLATLFALAALVLFTGYRSRWARHGAGPAEVMAVGLWVALLALLSVLSKENGALLLWLIPVIEVAVFQGQWAGRERCVLQRCGWLALWAPLVLFAVLLVLSPDTFLGGYTRREFTATERVLTQLRLLWQYLAWMIFPDINSMGFQHDDISLSKSWFSPMTTFWSGTAWLTTLVAAFALRRRSPLLLFGLLFYLVGHFMESGLWPLEMVYEHRNYLPSVGVYIALSGGVVTLWRRIPAVSITPVAFGLVATSAVLLALRVYTWSDSLRLAGVNVDNHPGSSRSHFFLAEALLKAYRRPGESELTEKNTEFYLVRARNEFELMYQRNPRDLAAIVMLYTMDQSHFPQLQQYRDWFAELQMVVSTRPLQASDYNALEALLDCFEVSVCKEPAGRLALVFDTLQSRYVNNSRLIAMRYRLMKVTGAPADERLAFIQEAAAERPGSSKISRYLLSELALQHDVGGLYNAVRTWMANDPARRQLTAIRRMFEAPAPEHDGGAPP